MLWLRRVPVKEDDRVSRLKDPEGGVQTEEGLGLAREKQAWVTVGVCV